ncbi:MAG: four helix bundle protein [Vicinamibacterales bacterium]
MNVADALRERTFEFAARTVALCQGLPEDWRTREVGRQLLRSATGTAANYRAACRGRSRREFIAKLGVAVEEVDETVFWLELIDRARLSEQATLKPLHAEAQELRAILARSHRTARRNNAPE